MLQINKLNIVVLSIFIVYCGTVNVSFTQTDYQWAEEGATWHYTNNQVAIIGYTATEYIRDTVTSHGNYQLLKSISQKAWKTNPTDYYVQPIQNAGQNMLKKVGDSVFFLRNNIDRFAFKTNAIVGEVWDLGTFSINDTTSNVYVKVVAINEVDYSGEMLKEFSLVPCDENGNTFFYRDTLSDGSPVPTNFLISRMKLVNEKFGPMNGLFSAFSFSIYNPDFIDEVMDQVILCYSSNITPTIYINSLNCTNGLNLLSLENENITPISIYPNPFSENLNFNHLKSHSIVQVYDLCNKKIVEFTANHENAILETSAFASGVYFIHIYETGKEQQIIKVIKD